MAKFYLVQPASDAEGVLTNASVVSAGALPQTISGFDPGTYRVASLAYAAGTYEIGSERFVATRASTPDEILSSSSQLYSRTIHTACDTVTSLKFAFANWYVNSTGVEVSGGEDMTLYASVEYPLDSTPIRIPFGGAEFVAISGGSTAISDAVAISIPAGAQFAVRTLQSKSDGAMRTVQNRNNTADREQAGTGELSDLTLTSTLPLTRSTSGYSPVAIIGVSTLPALMLLGDSRVRGFGEVSGAALKGEFERSLGSIGFANAARSAARVSAVATAGSFSRRAALANAYCTHVLSNFGVNDSMSGRTAEQILGDLETLAGLFDKPFFQSTISPSSSSSDGWATVEGQTPHANDARRIAVNAGIRAMPAWLDGYFEVADVTESARDSGSWKAGYTSDGIHANTTGYAAIEASGVITPASFG